MHFTGDDILKILQIVLFLAPVIGIVWKLSGVVRDIELNKININSLRDNLTKDIDNLGKKINDLVIQRQNEVINLYQSVEKLTKEIVAVKENTKYLQSAVEEIKTDVKSLMMETRV